MINKFVFTISLSDFDLGILVGGVFAITIDRLLRIMFNTLKADKKQKVRKDDKR